MMQSAIAVLPGGVRVPPLAPLVVLAFLGAGALVFCCVVGAAIALAVRRPRLARLLGGFGLAAAAAYAIFLVGAAFVSRDRILAVGEQKYFCEIDCHIAYTVEAGETSPNGNRSVRLRTWFDPSTIASFRGNGPLAPGPRTVYLVDASGRRYDASMRAAVSTPLTRELRPGESYVTVFEFRTPPEAAGLRLFVGDPPGLETFLIGHENSPFHGKVYFAIEPRA